MVRRTVAVLVLMIVLFAGSSFADESKKEKTAAKIAEKWLTIIDEGEYGVSWEAASDYFKSSLPKEKWISSLEGIRKMFGNMLSRKVASTGFFTSLPGAPDGEYVVVTFETVFEKKKSAIETVTPMKDKDGKWRPSGYYIK